MGIQQNVNQILGSVGNAVVGAKVASAADQARKEADFKRTVEEGEGIEKATLEAAGKEMELHKTNKELRTAESEYGKANTKATIAQERYEASQKDPTMFYGDEDALRADADILHDKAALALQKVEEIKRMKASQLEDLSVRRDFIKNRVEAYNKKVAKKYPGLPQYDVKGGKK